MGDPGEPELDFDLLAAWQSGDRGAGTRLVHRHYARVLRFFELRAGFLAEDLTQQTFLACVAARDGIRQGSTFRAFLFGIARRQLVESQRRSVRHDMAMERAVPWDGFETSVSGRVARRKEQQILLHAMTQLPDDLLVLVQLYYWEGMRVREIGAVLEVVPSTLASRLARARELLREAIERLTPRPELREAIIRDLDAWARSLATIPLVEHAAGTPEVP